MIKTACREKHISSYIPSYSLEVREIANDLKRLYEMQGYDTRLDISTVTITVTATRIIGVEKGEEE